jgi:flagellum-specific ATP synthase
MKALAEQINELDAVEIYGRVVGVRGLMVEVAGPLHAMSVGARVIIETPGKNIPCEVVGFSAGNALLMPFGPLEGVRRGCRALVSSVAGAVRPSPGWLGRVVNALGEPIDGKGPLLYGPSPYPFRNIPPLAHARRRVGAPLDLGVRALNTFVTCCRGQRMGIFSGSGVGKSVLLSMLARNVAADVSVIGLIGERGREVQEFLQDDLGEAGLARSVVVVSTSDEPALMRRQAAHVTLAIAEYFRDEGKDVLVLMDSVTRFAMAQREIGLSAGEPPTAKGYTPTVFTELPRLLERAGPGTEQGTITGIFTVLVDGDDYNEPIADAVRGILDGHIVMERAIAERGRYPAINVLKSVSRTMPRAADQAYLPVLTRARAVMATYADMEELIRLGAYRAGTSPRSMRPSACTSRWRPFWPKGRTRRPPWRKDTADWRKSWATRKPNANVIVTRLRSGRRALSRAAPLQGQIGQG